MKSAIDLSSSIPASPVLRINGIDLTGLPINGIEPSPKPLGRYKLPLTVEWLLSPMDPNLLVVKLAKLLFLSSRVALLA